MIEDKHRTSLIVLENENVKNTFVFNYKSYYRRLIRALINTFVIRKRVYIAFSVIYALFFLFGVGISSFHPFVFVFIKRFFSFESFIIAFAVYWIFVVLSGFTYFGKPLSVVTNILHSTFFGISQYSLFFGINLQNGWRTIIATVILSVCVFLTIVISTEIYISSCKLPYTRSLFKFKPTYIYLCSETLLVLFLFFSYKLYFILF